MFDCLVIGGGPAGLTAAIYLARYHLSVIVVDDGNSRANLIPLSRNHAGFPRGISGSDLLKRMRDQAAPYGVHRQEDKILELDRYNGTFISRTQSGEIHSATVLLATGVINRQPDMPRSCMMKPYSGGLCAIVQFAMDTK
jgi:thioredoxin reductase (NADPH)